MKKKNNNKSNGILVLTELFLPTKGGTAVWFDSVYRLMGKTEIHIITDEVPGADGYDRKHPNSVHRISFRRIGWLKPESLVMYVKLFYCSFILFLTYKFSVIHAGRVLPEGLVGLFLKWIFQKPLVIYAHGEEITTWRQHVKFTVMKNVYKKANCVIANSSFTKNELLKLGVAESKIVGLSPGVDIQHFTPGLRTDDLKERIGVNKEAKLLLSVGRLTRRKGFDTIIKSLPILKKRGLEIHYAVIGTGEDKHYLNQLAREGGVSECVHFLGHVSEAELPRWYNASDLFAMPNREIKGDTEGFGMVFLEANACGKPVIAGMAGGTGESVLDGQTGFRINGEAVDEFAECMYRLLQDPGLSKQLGENGLERVRQDFSWTTIALKTQKINQSLIE